MKKSLIFPFVISLLISFFLTSCSSSSSPATSDTTTSLEGSWKYHSLRSGNSKIWRYGTEQIDANGTATRISINRSNGQQNVGSPYTLSADASNNISNSESASFHGTLSSNLIVNTQTKGSGSNAYRLQLFLKQGGSYSQSDLAGNWDFHILDSGNTSDWRHGVEQIDTSGTVTRVSRVMSNGSTTVGSSYSLNVDSSGNITRPDVSTYHGAMSQDKSLMVNTRSRESNTTYALLILQKQGGSFSSADLQGTWNFHKLISGPGAEWRYGVDSIDANGLVTRVSRLRSGGTTDTGPIHTLAITANGVVSRTDQPSFHGVMSQDKNLIVVTNTSGNSSSFHMKVYQRAN